MATGETAYCLALRPDEGLLLGGNFQGYHYAQRNGLAQLTPAGSIDGDFDPGTGVNKGGAVYTMALQADGRAIVAGNFTTFNDQARNSIARINADGSLDVACTAGSGPDNSIGSMVVQSDGKLVLVGKFAFFDGARRNGICRLQPVPAPPRLSVPTRSGSGQVEIRLFGETAIHYSVEASTNLLDWASITNFTATRSEVPIFDSQAAALTKCFYRALAQ